MKKITAIILALTCVFALISCRDEKKPTIEDHIKDVETMYAASAPTKIVTTIKTEMAGSQEGSSKVFNGERILVTGKIGDKIATVYTYWQEQLREISDGSGSTIVPAIEVVQGSKEFLQGSGLRVNGGRWESTGLNFAPSAGDIALNLDPSLLIEPAYENNVLTFKVSAANAETVLASIVGEELDDDAITEDFAVSVTNAGSVITSVTLTYTINENGDYPAQHVTIVATYTYDLEKITLTK